MLIYCKIFSGITSVFKKVCLASVLIVLWGAINAATFAQAKKQMYFIYQDHRMTMYCDCPFSKQKRVDLAVCGYDVRRSFRRARRTEAEHIVPAAEFGRQFQCWQEPICTRRNGTRYKGRECCERVNEQFRAMYTDLMNLAPAVGEVNQDRRDYRFGVIDGGGGYGRCEMIIDHKAKMAYPPEHARGFIARVYLYMQAMYDLKLDPLQQKLFQAWNEQYPKSEWEVIRENRISQIQS
ncbi:MAG: hypothetical protein GKR77_05745 [Legionellales bacterium]|nr:hypothetical protein [Legionellales bacterium]